MAYFPDLRTRGGAPLRAALTVLAACGGEAMAQTEGAADPGIATPPVTSAAAQSGAEATPQRIVIVGARPGSQALRERLESTAPVHVIDAETLGRHGDTSLGEALNRVPGVRWDAAAGGTPTLRGLGGGYTRFTVDGEEMPEGFDLSTLAPEQVERIVVRRSPTVESGGRAMAGAIDVVLKEAGGPPGQRVRATLGVERGRWGPGLQWSANGSLPGAPQDGAKGVAREAAQGPGQGGAVPLAWSLTLDASAPRSTESTLSTLARSQAPEAETLSSSAELQRERLSANGRLRWTLGEGSHFTLTPMAIVARRHGLTEARLDRPRDGAPAPWQSARTTREGEFQMGRLQAHRVQRVGDDTRLEWRLGGTAWDYRVDDRRTESGGLAPQDRLDATAMTQRTLGASMKTTTAWGEDHSVVAGWEWERLARTERGQSLPGALDAGGGGGASLQNLEARTVRWAGFVQDEWPLTPSWTAQAGLRWERIETRGEGGPAHAGAVWSPMLHAVWRPSGIRSDRWRVGLTKTYRAPSIGSLIARPTLSSDNAPTRPDRNGNPALQPERALGVDVGVERHLKGGGVLSANVFQREVQDVIRRVVTQDADSGRWVSTPRNLGHATARGLELEASVGLRTLFGAQAPAVDLRADAAWYRSRVHSVPGPGNRLERQPAFEAQAGADWAPRDTTWRLGVSVRATPAYLSRSSVEDVNERDARGGVDAYAAWRLGDRTSVRLAAANLVPLRQVTVDRYDDGSLSETRTTRTRSATAWTLRVERRL